MRQDQWTRTHQEGQGETSETVMAEAEAVEEAALGAEDEGNFKIYN